MSDEPEDDSFVSKLGLDASTRRMFDSIRKNIKPASLIQLSINTSAIPADVMTPALQQVLDKAGMGTHNRPYKWGADLRLDITLEDAAKLGLLPTGRGQTR